METPVLGAVCTVNNCNKWKGLRNSLASRQDDTPVSRGVKAAETRAKNKERDKRASEVSGVLLIGAGILAAAYLFFSATGYLGEVLGKALFGLLGVISYALPFILIGVGVIYIRGSASDRPAGSGWYMLLGILALVTLLQTIRTESYDGVLYMDYLNEAFSTGQTARMGGGFVGAVLSYPLLLLGGKTLAYTLSILMVLVCSIAITGFSIHDITKKLTGKVASAVETAREERQDPKSSMFTLTLEGEPEPSVKGKKALTAPAPMPEPVFMPSVKDESNGKKRGKAGAPQKIVAEVQPKKELREFGGEFAAKSGATPKRKEIEIVTPDFGKPRDFEPQDDVPFAVKSRSKAEPPKTAPLPDPAPLFGTQPVKASSKPGPARQPGVTPRAAQTAAKPRTQPQAIVPGAKYRPPEIDLLEIPLPVKEDASDSPTEKARILLETLASFHIGATVTDITVGPALTRIEIQPASGVRISRITALQSDLTMALAAPRLRLEAPIPGKNAIGVEVPNKRSALVLIRDVVESREFRASASPLTMALGREASGKVIVADLASMPHLLIAGATGSGKSVCINAIIVSMTYKSSPADLRFILIDPKKVELAIYASIPHLYMPVVTDNKKAAIALRAAVKEMEDRYKKFTEVGAKNLERYNAHVKGTPDYLPSVVVVIDELADLMMISPEDVEDSIQRIAQMGRAAGVHLILATQRPDASVITGIIKANVPARIAFAVSNALNSRIILDMSGAEKLLGKGDMLFQQDGGHKALRLQGAYISDDEVDRVMAHFRAQQPAPVYDERIMEKMAIVEKSGATGGPLSEEGEGIDDKLGAAVRVALEYGQASTSMIQRRLRVGYSRAGRLLDDMEKKGYVTPFNGSKPRDVIITPAQYAEIFGDETPIVRVTPHESNPMGDFYRGN